MNSGDTTRTDRARPTTAAALTLLVCLSTLVGVASANGLEGRLSTTAPVDIIGSVDAWTDHAAVNAETPDLQVQLVADQIETRIEWEDGYITAQRPDETATKYVANAGVDWYNFTSAEVGFASFAGTPEVLSLPGTAPVSVQAAAPGSTEATTVRNQTLANHGEKEGSGTRQPAGFWYTLEAPYVAVTGADRATVTGDFTLFVNNVTIQVTDSEQGTWENWTGYQETNPDSPAGPLDNPAAKEYNLRATTLHVTNGSLSINAANTVDLYTKDANAMVHGPISAPSVSGELLSEPLLYRFDGDPLQLTGDGRLDLGVAPEGSTGPADAASSAPPLALAPSGGFDVQPTAGVEVANAETTRVWNPISWFDVSGTDAWFALTLLTLVAGVAIGVRASKRVRPIAATRSSQAEPSGDPYQCLLDDAWEALDRERLVLARTLYSKALAMDPRGSEAYHGLMVVHKRAGRLQQALKVARRADETFDELPKRIASFWAYCAHEHGATDQVVEAWLKLAQVSPRHALILYAEEDYKALEDPRVQARVLELKQWLAQVDPELASRLGGRFNGSNGSNGDTSFGSQLP